jgi:hypothetical protein
MRLIIFLLAFVSITNYLSGQNLRKTEAEKDTWKTAGLNRGMAGDQRLKMMNKYVAMTSQGVTIESSYPKGSYATDASGRTFPYRIFFYRVINETTTPFELVVNFPADSFAIPLASDYYSKVFLLQDTMTLNKETLYSYGVNGMDSSSITSFSKPTVLKRTINPKEESLFYIGVVFYTVSETNQVGAGVIRAELVLEGKELFYKINALDPLLIPCGRIVFKN